LWISGLEIHQPFSQINNNRSFLPRLHCSCVHIRRPSTSLPQLSATLHTKIFG
jgi:hypothetical protein